MFSSVAPTSWLGVAEAPPTLIRCILRTKGRAPARPHKETGSMVYFFPLDFSIVSKSSSSAWRSSSCSTSSCRIWRTML